MKRSVLVILAVALLVSAGAAADDAAKMELKKLEGTWKVVKMEVAGKPVDKANAKKLQFVIKGDQITMEPEGEPGKAMGLKIDPKQKPKALDLIITKGDQKTDWKCIYELEGNTFKLLMPMAPRKGQKGKTEGYGILKRPESFEATGKPFMVFTAERQKK